MKDIIELAKEAGFPDPTISANWFETLERFAALVRAKVIETIKMHIPRSGHTTPEMLFAKKIISKIEKLK